MVLHLGHKSRLAGLDLLWKFVSLKFYLDLFTQLGEKVRDELFLPLEVQARSLEGKERNEPMHFLRLIERFLEEFCC